MRPFLALTLLFLLLAPASAASPTRLKRATQPEAQTAELQVAEITAEDVARWKLIQRDGELRSEEYKPESAPPLAVEPAVPRGERLNNILNLAELVVPLIVGFAGGASAPKILSIFSTILGVARKVQPPVATPTDPTVNPQSATGLIRLGEILKALAPVIQELSKGGQTSTDTK